MQNSVSPRFAISSRFALLLGLVLTPFTARAVEDPLPSKPLPIGNPDQVEIRTVEELRPGLTRVNIKRGPWDKQRPNRPQYTFMTVRRTQEERAAVRACFEKAGYVAREKRYEPEDGEPYYVITAGVFGSQSELVEAAKTVPCEVQIGRLDEGESIDEGLPHVIDIVVLDPKIFKGKMVSAWSENAWPASPMKLAAKHKAVVATNGSFFEYLSHGVLGVPTAISIVQGLWHHEHYPEEKGALILFIENHEDGNITLSISDKVPPMPEFKWGQGKSTVLDSIDRMPGENELIAIKSSSFIGSHESHGNFPKTASWLALYEETSGQRYYVMATGSKREIIEEAKQSGFSSLDLGVPGRPGLNAFYTTPGLIVNGKSATEELSVYRDRFSRTTVGADADGKIYLIVAHGYTSEYDSDGLTFSELINIGEQLGLVNFANLDGGGGSTSMVVEGKVLGDPDTPIYDDRRRVGDSVLIIDDK